MGGELESIPAESGRSRRVAKRMASDEPGTPSNAKKIKTDHDGLAQSAVQRPVVRPRVPFPDKVRYISMIIQTVGNKYTNLGLLKACSTGRTQRRDRIQGSQ